MLAVPLFVDLNLDHVPTCVSNSEDLLFIVQAARVALRISENANVERQLHALHNHLDSTRASCGNTNIATAENSGCVPRWFTDTSIILLLNNVAKFKGKLSRSPLGTYFPGYSDGDDVNSAAKYIFWRFNQVNRKHLSLYPQIADSSATINIRLVFSALKETFLNNALKRVPLVSQISTSMSNSRDDTSSESHSKN